MATPTKNNKNATPLTVQPGSPHWIKPAHGQKSFGQGYDFHDPVGLQQADSQGAYESGQAVLSFGKVEFELTVNNVNHGMVFDLDLVRKFGSTGAFEFWLEWDPSSTGLMGDVKTDIEHGFDITKIDFDLTTLNPGVSADPYGNNRVKVRFEDGQVRLTLKAIAAYRTNVRTYDPVVLQKPYTYWIKERFNAYAGQDEDAMMAQHEPWASNPTFRIGCESVASGYTRFKYSLNNLKLVDEAAFLEPTSNAYKYRSEVQQHWAYYKILSLPVPVWFIDPSLQGSPAVPGKETWKNDFQFYEHDNLLYTVGLTRDCVGITRVYVHSQGGNANGRTGAPVLDTLPCCKDTVGRCSGDSKGSYFSRTPPWDGGIGTEPPHETGIMGVNMHQTGLTDSWTEPFEFKYSPTGKFNSGYESVKEFAFGADASDFWSVNYTGWINEPAGEMMFLGDEPADIEIDSGFNMLFNWHGTPLDGNVANGKGWVSIDETRVRDMSGAADGFDRVPYDTFSTWIAKTGDNRGWVPFDNYNGRGGSSGIDMPFGNNTVVGKLVEWYETRKPPVERWAYDEQTMRNQPGMGENGQSNTLYNISSMMHPLTSYEKNLTLKGYYMCCTDHVDKNIKLKLYKVNDSDLVELGTNVTQTTFINKSSLYNIQNHGQYNGDINPNYGMPPGNVYADFQAWDEKPVNPSLTKQLFEPLGADLYDPVLFLSLKKGQHTGGTDPGTNLPKPKPKTKPILQLSRSTVRETETQGSVATYTISYINIGGDDAMLSLNNKPDRGFASTTGTKYGLINSIGPAASGDKLDDWTWAFAGTPRFVQGSTNTVHLSSTERVDVTYTVDIQTANPNGYNIWHGHQFDQGVLYGGIINGKLAFEIVPV